MGVPERSQISWRASSPGAHGEPFPEGETGGRIPVMESTLTSCSLEDVVAGQPWKS